MALQFVGPALMGSKALAPIVPVAKQVGGYLLLDQAINNAPAIMSGVSQFMMGDPSRNPNTIVRPKREKRRWRET